MKIALDATYSAGENLTGVGVYSLAILNGLTAAHPESQFRFCYRAHRFLGSFRKAIPKNASRGLLVRGLAPTADLFHALNQRLDFQRGRRTVSTFHDLFVISGDYSTAEFRARFSAQARQAAERSHLIIAVSQFTARQLEQLLNVDPARIRVIHHGAARPAEPPHTDEREQIVLFVGALQRRKNIARLVEAFEQTPRGWRLALAGSSGFGVEEIMARVASSPRRADIQTLGFVSDEVLSDLYRRASIFAFPSLDEGFGMPVLDAMSNGLPVLTSNISALPEVAGDAALLVNPADAEAIATGLNQMIGDSGLRARLSQAGLARVKEFTWEKAVQKTWNVYQELVGQP